MSQVANRTSKKHFDIQLCLYAYALAIFGVIAVTAATYSPSSDVGLQATLFARITGSYNGRWQGIFLLVSPLVIGGVMAFNYQFLGRLSWLMYIVACVLLVFVLFTQANNNVRGWFNIMFDRTIQPAELAKIAIIIHLARRLSRKENPISGVVDLLRMGAEIALPTLLILVGGELGSVVVFVVFFMAMILIAGVDMKYILFIVAAGTILVVIAIFAMRDSGSYRFERLLAFVFPSQASSDATYQSTNSKIAIGSGGLQGQGLFQNGSLSSLNFVPEDHTDFIFSSIGETMGFVGCAFLILLYVLLIGRMMVLAYHTTDKFGQLIIVGVLSMMLYHVVQGIGMTIGTMPVMGIPLPFVSYGGSNLTANMAGIGLVLNVTMRKPQSSAGRPQEGLQRTVSIPKHGRRRATGVPNNTNQ